MDDDQLESHVRETISEIIKLLHDRGITQISVGGLLRIMGVPNHMATRHDLDYLDSTDTVDLDSMYIKSAQPSGTLLH